MYNTSFRIVGRMYLRRIKKSKKEKNFIVMSELKPMQCFKFIDYDLPTHRYLGVQTVGGMGYHKYRDCFTGQEFARQVGAIADNYRVELVKDVV